MASPEPLPGRRIAEIVDDMTTARVAQVVAELNNRYMLSAAAYRIRELARGYQFYIIPEFTGYVEQLLARQRKMRLTRASLETLAIVAYRQPVTRTEIEHVRGVASDGVIHNLMEKKLLTIRGRAATVGKALQYGTTDEFLKFFGLGNLEDLPRMSEIEELVSSREPQPQTELELTGGKENGAGAKLNIADGTYDPNRTIEVDELSDKPQTTEGADENGDGDASSDHQDETIDTDKAERERAGLIIGDDGVPKSS